MCERTERWFCDTVALSLPKRSDFLPHRGTKKTLQITGEYRRRQDMEQSVPPENRFTVFAQWDDIRSNRSAPKTYGNRVIAQRFFPLSVEEVCWRSKVGTQSQGRAEIEEKENQGRDCLSSMQEGTICRLRRYVRTDKSALW